MVAGSAGSANAPPYESCDELLFLNGDIEHMLHLPAAAGEEFIQFFCLVYGSRETVEKESFFAVVFEKSCAGNFYNQIIGNKLAFVHIFLSFLAELRSLLDVFSEDIPG